MLHQFFDDSLVKSMTDSKLQIRYTVHGKALTTNYASSGLSFGNTEVCDVKGYGSISNATFHLVDTYADVEDPADPRQWYDRFSWEVLPTLTVFMPVANARRTTSLKYPVTAVHCLGVKQFIKGSRVPAAAPEPLPLVASSKGLGGGAIAGIVVGAVVGVGATVIVVWFRWLRKKKVKRQSEAIPPPPPPSYPDDKPRYAEIDPLAPAEIDDGKALQEMDSTEAYRSELPSSASKDPVELAGSALFEQVKEKQ
jgi:hypothetical protein